MRELTRGAAVARAIGAVERRCDAVASMVDGIVGRPTTDLRAAGRLTISFHPDRLDRRGLTVAEGLVVDGGYLPQWVTGASSGSRSAVDGGLRASWERQLFDVGADTAPRHRPVYGTLDLLRHRHGGSPAFGSCFIVLRDAVSDRCTLSVGDSHLGPDRVGTFARPRAVVAGLAEQASPGALLGQPLGPDDLAAVLRGERRAAPRRTLDEYVELQVHGGVDLADIAAIVADPSFRDHRVEELLRRATAEAGASFAWHPGTVIAPADLRYDAAAVDWVQDDDYLARLVGELTELCSPSPLATAADIGRLVDGQRPGAPRRSGDAPRSALQRVKHLWRLTYLLGRDAEPSVSAV